MTGNLRPEAVAKRLRYRVESPSRLGAWCTPTYGAGAYPAAARLGSAVPDRVQKTHTKKPARAGFFTTAPFLVFEQRVSLKRALPQGESGRKRNAF